VSDSAVGSPRGERRYGRYIVLDTLGSGAMGEVLRARDERLGREVALKTVRNVFGMQKATFRERFDAEARALAALSHPAVVAVHDLGHERGADGEDEPYLVMELVDGPSLRARLEKHGPMSAAEVRAMGIQLARGLEAAHARKILHRDIKPANILLAPTGQWKLADFGVAHVPDSSVTITGQFLGTPAYAAPEALALGQFSEKSDVFGLAVTLVESLTGERLRGNVSLSEMVRAGDAAAIDLPASVPPDLARALRPALSMDANKRPTAARFAEMLAGAEAGEAAVSTAVLAPPNVSAPRPVVSAAHPAVSGVDMTVPVASIGGPMSGQMSVAPVPDTRASTPAAMRAATPTPLPTHVGAPPDPARQKRMRLIAGIAGAVVLVGIIAALAAGGGGKSAPASAPSAFPSEEPRAEEPEAPPVDPNAPIRIRHPTNLDRKSAKEWEKVVDKLYERKLDEALEKLYSFERRFGATEETADLRAQIEAKLAAFGYEDD
jgi:serine/threonine-protein kinase